MGDIGDYWREHKEYAKTQKLKRRNKGFSVVSELDKAGIEYYQLSEEHYRIPMTNFFFDWWPSTGKWRSKDGKQSGYNVRPLIKAVKARGQS